MNVKRLTDEERIRNKREYNRKRDKEKIKKYLLRLDREGNVDKLLIDYINSKPNKNEFLRNLILNEFENELKNGTYYADLGEE
ncbi:MAG: hypothetical protein MR601_07230 [Erysipelotrichaceae bacterium]|nr:hypothetical protein [Erysipelotrichaceae bacterium]